MLDHEVIRHRAKLLKPFAEARGQQLMLTLIKGELCTHELCDKTGIPQSTVSYHMNILYKSGLVERRKDGKWTYYRLRIEGIEDLKREFESLSGKCEDVLNMLKR